MKFINIIKRLEGVWFLTLMGSLILLAIGVRNDLSSAFFVPSMSMFFISLSFMIIAHKTN